MSRIGKKTITIPVGFSVEVKDGGSFSYKQIIVKGANGELIQSVQRGVGFEIKENELVVIDEDQTKESGSYHGLYRTLIQNMIDGLLNGYSKNLELVGIGYRAEQQGNKLVLSVGYSHKINYEPPAGITIKVTEQVNINISGADKQLVGEVAAKIRAYRKPEPYKGKGIRYKGEKVRKKSTKSTK